jgi:hypothetical protein
MEQTAIVKQQVDLSTWQMLREAAPIMYKSRFFGVATEEQAIAIMVKGHELGLGLATSFEFIQPVLGKPCLIPRGALALAYSSGLMENFTVTEEKDDKGLPYSCTVSGNRKGQPPYSLTFTIEDAMRAKIVKGDSAWETWRANMLRWRTIGFWLDVVMPDTQGGMKRADEFGATVDAGGNVIDVTPVTVESTSQPVPVVVPTLEQLITQYGVDNVMAAIQSQSGAMPSNSDDILGLIGILEQNNG